MVLVPAGRFLMGSGHVSDELPTHIDSISSFHMDATEVTQGDYDTLMGVNPSDFTGDPRQPVEEVTWFDAVLYCNARSKRDHLDTDYSYSSVTGTPGNGCTNLGSLVIDLAKTGYHLPTEAQWEYACRSGSGTDYSWGRNYPPASDTDTLALDSNAVWIHDSPEEPAPVGSRKPNAFRLYDMTGNVWEWCNDWYGSYSTATMVNPIGPDTGSYRVLRGGSWSSDAIYLRSSCRVNVDPSTGAGAGFRCVR